MCRLFGTAASAPIDVSFELLEAENPLLDQSEQHDSGWGIASYRHGQPVVRRFPQAAHSDPGFRSAADVASELVIAHVRRATIGGLRLENTHPFAEDRFTYCHNGTIIEADRLLERTDRRPKGDTDSERFFCLLMALLDPADVVGSLRRTVEATCERCRFSALNLLFSDGTRLYAYRFGLYEMFRLVRNLDLDADTRTHYHVHLERPHGEHVAMASSERLTEGEPWEPFGQDELLICDPRDPDHPRIERLLGDGADSVEFEPFEPDRELAGAERGSWAAEQARAQLGRS